MTRVLLGVAGLAGVLYGLFLLLGQGATQVLDAGVWLVGGVVAHDAVLAPVVLVLGVVAVRLLPGAARAPVVVGLVVLGTVTLVAVPVLGQFGASPGNPTLLDRDYVAGWCVLAGLTAVAVAGAILYRKSRGGRSERGLRDGR
jgi:hypothetical protein